VKREAPTARSTFGIPAIAVSAAACALSPSNARMPRAIPQPPAAASPAQASQPEPGAAEERDEAREPLVFDSPFADLAISGYPSAVVGLPDNATSARPVVVVIHGLGGKPEPQCQAWRSIVRAWGFVLCPRGEYDPERSMPGDKRYVHPGGPRLRAHIDAALAALAQRYAGYVDAERPALAGFSLGATEVALLAQKASARFPRLAVLEGGLDVWYAPTIDAFAADGGVRVLFGCGSAWCPRSAGAAAARIDQRPGVEAHVASAPVGHTNAPPLQEAIRAELRWFFAGDERWTAAL
jgi:predicted esterase